MKLTVIILLVLLSFNHFAQNIWNDTDGPYFYSSNTVDVSPGGRVILTPGMYLTDNYGLSWKRISEEYVRFAIFINDDTILTQSMYSHNEGTDWTNYGENYTFNNIAADDSGRIWGVTFNNMYYSDDFGKSWTLSSAAPAVTEFFLLGDTVIYRSNNRVFKTDRKFQQSLQLLPDSIGVYSIARNKAGLIIIGGVEEVFCSEDTGRSWRRSKISVNGNYKLGVNSIEYSGDSILYAGLRGAGVFKSSDRGVNWSSLNSGLGTLIIKTIKYDSVRNDLYAGTEGAVYVLRNESTKWEQISRFERTDVTDIFGRYNNSGEYVLYAHGGRGVYSSTDRGNSWTFYDNYFLPFAADSYGNLYAPSYWGEFFYHEKDAHSWILLKQDSLLTGSIYIDQDDSIYVSDITGRIYKSADKLESYRIIQKDSIGSFSAFTVSEADSSLGHLFIGTGTGIYRTTNGGNTWDKLWTNPSNKAVTSIVIPKNGKFSNTIFAAVRYGGVIRSTDNGLTWAQPDPASGVSEVNNIAADSKGDIFVSTIKTVLKLNDEGNKWINVGHNIYPTDSYCIFIDPDDNIYAGTVFTHGILKSNTSFLTSVEGDFGVGDPGFALSQNYPNPFNPVTVINFHLSEPGFVSLKVYNILGKEVTSLLQEFKPAGNYSIQFSGEGLSSGIYIYELSSGKNSIRRKMLLLK